MTAALVTSKSLAVIIAMVSELLSANVHIALTAVCLSELQNFIVLVRVTKLGESDIVWQSDLLNHTSEQYMSLAKAARSQLDSVQVTEELKDNYIGSDVMSIEQAVDGHGVLVNLTIHLTEGDNLDEDLLKEKLARTLEKSSEQLPSPSQVYADLEDVVDFDECSSEEYNDCATSARCSK